MLCSFEGPRRAWSRPVSGGYGERETPLPIPNRAVKPLSADGTWPARAWESRTPPVFTCERAPDASERAGLVVVLGPAWQPGRGRRAALRPPARCEVARGARARRAGGAAATALRQGCGLPRRRRGAGDARCAMRRRCGCGGRARELRTRSSGARRAPARHRASVEWLRREHRVGELEQRGGGA